mgnify:CR=1 FL=1
MTRKYLVAGNWKMNGSLKANAELLSGIAAKAGEVPGVELLVCPTAVHLESVGKSLPAGVALGAQNLSEQTKAGAFTGEILGSMLTELGVRYVLVGHSERRSIFGESDELVGQKTTAALESGLSVILCVGESLEQREKNESVNVVIHQLETATKDVKDWGKIVIAYEPVWAIGTGKVATAEQAQEVHAAIRQWLAKKADQKVVDATRVIYGGSVAAKNCKELASQPDIDGFLVGGASLKPEFADIVNARL